jgi:hypothetical protein
MLSINKSKNISHYNGNEVDSIPIIHEESKCSFSYKSRTYAENFIQGINKITFNFIQDINKNNFNVI